MSRAVSLLEPGVRRDVDDLEPKAGLGPDPLDDLERRLAQMAAPTDEDDDFVVRHG